MITIAIDGPSGAGKSTIADGLSKKLNIIHFNTGALYRAIAVFAYDHDLDHNNINDINYIVNNCKITVKYLDEKQHTFVNNVDVSNQLYTKIIGEWSKDFSSKQIIRDLVFNLQLEYAKNFDLVMEGRDICTHVLKDIATNKYYITASLETRTKRRVEDLTKLAKNQKDLEKISFESIKESLYERDKEDMERIICPLTIAPDAEIIETDNKTAEEVVEYICNQIKK